MSIGRGFAAIGVSAAVISGCGGSGNYFPQKVEVDLTELAEDPDMAVGDNSTRPVYNPLIGQLFSANTSEALIDQYPELDVNVSCAYKGNTERLDAEGSSIKVSIDDEELTFGINEAGVYLESSDDNDDFGTLIEDGQSTIVNPSVDVETRLYSMGGGNAVEVVEYYMPLRSNEKKVAVIYYYQTDSPVDAQRYAYARFEYYDNNDGSVGLDLLTVGGICRAVS